MLYAIGATIEVGGDHTSIPSHYLPVCRPSPFTLFSSLPHFSLPFLFVLSLSFCPI